MKTNTKATAKLTKRDVIITEADDDFVEVPRTKPGIIEIGPNRNGIHRVYNHGSQVVRIGSNARHEFEQILPCESTYIKALGDFGMLILTEPLNDE